ncbi:t1pks [Epichloe bromicola]|uniref:T1pks n=1 Tax=Epichloe bromicola TaxID=79588 RepID=A0ABQ0CYL5_9HYPO
MATHRTLLVFGPGVMSLDEPYSSRIFRFAKQDGASQWAVHDIEGIEHIWASLCEAIPKLQLTPSPCKAAGGKASIKAHSLLSVVNSDYENNISHTCPTAFSATGALRGYIVGKVSHFFAWAGPGMTVDTECSASIVAIDLACRVILSGDCTAALAGGTNVYSTLMFFQNLAATSFLSPTGQCKPFHAEAAGYCRGETIGAVFLKKLSEAVDDGDQVLGVIKATFIN